MKRVLRSETDYKQTLLRNQLTSLITHGRLTTTKSLGAKLIPYADHFFNRIRPNDLVAKKLVHKTLFGQTAIKRVFDELLPNLGESQTSFVKRFAVASRSGDAAPMMLVSLNIANKPTAVKEKPKSGASVAKPKKGAN